MIQPVTAIFIFERLTKSRWVAVLFLIMSATMHPKVTDFIFFFFPETQELLKAGCEGFIINMSLPWGLLL